MSELVHMPADLEKAALEPAVSAVPLSAGGALELSTADGCDSEDHDRALQAVLVDASLSLAVFVLASALAGQQFVLESALCALSQSSAAPGFMAFRNVESLACSDVEPWIIGHGAHLIGFALVVVKLLCVRRNLLGTANARSSPGRSACSAPPLASPIRLRRSTL